MRPSARPATLLGTFCAIALLAAACGGSGTSEQTSLASEADTNTLERAGAALKAAMVPTYGTEHSYVPSKELACAKTDFSDHLHLGTTSSHQPFGPPPAGLVLSVADLLLRLDSVAPCDTSGPVQRCVIVHFGLNGTNQFDVRLQLLCLSYDSLMAQYSYAASNDCYRIKTDSTLELVTNGLTPWRAPGGGWDNYLGKVVILSGTGASWARLNRQTDPNSMVFSEVELRALIAQNKLEKGLLSLQPIATPEQRTPAPGGGYDEQGFHQGVAWVPLGVELDSIPYPETPYKHKALDLGNPCPAVCPSVSFAFWTKGTAPRSSCQ